MSQDELRCAYDKRRILVEASRILSPSFNAQGIYLTGAQIEMLRNITAYLNRRSTWVDTYYDTYYIMADDQDFSDILEIVADMEVKLMASENTPFGFWEPWAESLNVTASGPGTVSVQWDAVGEGEVLRLEAVSWHNDTGIRGPLMIDVQTGGAVTRLSFVRTPETRQPVVWSGVVTLQHDDLLTVRQWNANDNDVFIGAARGYKMKVPV